MASITIEEPYAEYETIYYIALGNVVPRPLEQTELPERFESMSACEWEPLRCWLRQNELFSTRQDKAILRDWQSAFELYGMAPLIPSWLPMVDKADAMPLATGIEQLQHWS